MTSRTRWTLIWVLLLVVVLVLEFIAIFNGAPGDTISENIWALLSLSWLLWLVVGVVLLWLTVHFLLPKVRDWWERRPWERRRP